MFHSEKYQNGNAQASSSILNSIPVATPTTNQYLDPNNSCGCFNGGLCFAYPEGVKVCRCHPSYAGNRCNDVLLTDDLRSNPSQESFPVATTVYIALAVLFVIALTLFVWRKYKSYDRRIWHKWQVSRRHSKSTIEGNTFSNPSTTCKVTQEYSNYHSSRDNCSANGDQEAVMTKEKPITIEMPKATEKPTHLPSVHGYINDIEVD